VDASVPHNTDRLLNLSIYHHFSSNGGTQNYVQVRTSDHAGQLPVPGKYRAGYSGSSFLIAQSSGLNNENINQNLHPPTEP